MILTLVLLGLLILVVLAFTPWTRFDRIESTKYLEWEHDFNNSMAINRKKMDITMIEKRISILNDRICNNAKRILELETKYPNGLKPFIKLKLKPDHFDLIELCGDEETDNKYSEVLGNQHELEDIIYGQEHIIDMYYKFCVIK